MAEQDPPIAPGLYLVGTPIGNLEDITLRALRILRSVDRVACEDTRQSQKLLNHFGISKPLVSCHEFNEHERTARLLDELWQGARIALITDAGMPGISDPGMELAAAALGAGLAVFPIPGANAALTALVASGLPTERFCFEGFLPEKAGARRTALEELAAKADEKSTTLIFYEAPHRIAETLADLESVFGAECRIALARELTKLHEEFLRGTVAEVRAQLAGKDRIRGEMTLVVECRAGQQIVAATTSVTQRVAELAADGVEEKDALKRIARERSLSKSDVYRELQRERSRR